MLFQPEKTTEQLIHGFKAWVDGQPKDKQYDFFSTDSCAFARYLKDQGFSRPMVHSFGFMRDGDFLFGKKEPLPQPFAYAIYGDNTFGTIDDQHTTMAARGYGRWTYGQLSERLTEAGY